MRDRIRHCPSPPDEALPIGFVRDFHGGRAMNHHEVKHPWTRFGSRARPARAEKCLPLGDDFGLNEEVAECWMKRVGRWRRQNNLSIARDVDHSSPAR